MARMSSKDRREDLIEAAIRVLVRDGVARATTRAIAAEAGVTLGVLHYCFTSQAELLEEAARRLTDRKAAAARESFASGVDLRASIAGSLRTFWQGVQEAPGEEQAGFELTQYALRHEGFEKVARRQYAHYLEVLGEFLESAAEAADVRFTVPVPVLARYINAMLEGLSMCWLVDRESERAEDVLDLLTDYLVGCTQPTR
jgi:AcrR family transcriptional regulator